MNCKVYEWLRLHAKGGNDIDSLYSLFKNDVPYYLQVCEVKPKGNYTNNVTGCILSCIAQGLFIVVLEDDCGGNTRMIRINRGLKIIYDCVETHEIQLNHDNLSKWCRPNCVFVRLCIKVELRDSKVHTTHSKDKITIDNLFKKILQVISIHAYSKLPQRLLMAF